MAKRLKHDDEPDRQHNVGEIKTIIADAARNIIRLKAERGKIQEGITEQRGRVKSLGIKMVDFGIALRLYELEFEDRDSSIDNLRVCFEALAIGGQGDLFPERSAADGDEANDDGEAKPRRRTRAARALDEAAAHLNS